MIERGWIGQCLGVDTDAIAHLRHQPEPIDKFREGVSFFLANTVCDDVSLAGKPESGGLPRVVSQSLFCYA
jgi:hypothetical protein